MDDTPLSEFLRKFHQDLQNQQVHQIQLAPDGPDKLVEPRKEEPIDVDHLWACVVASSQG